MIQRSIMSTNNSEILNQIGLNGFDTGYAVIAVGEIGRASCRERV